MNLLPASVLRTAALGCATVLLAGCATTGERHPSDPLESMNRGIYAFNHGVDRAALKPAAQAYRDYTPHWFRTGVSNFFFNLDTPITIVNQLLQGKLLAAGQDTLRFVLNTTLGLGGILDPAKDANLPRHDEDLGQTLGRWGVPPGPYLMLPFLGPSSLRDAPSHVVNRFLEPFYWYNAGNERWVSLGLGVLNTRASLLPLDATLERTYDPYGFIREAYIQRRRFLVYDGNPPEEPSEEPLEEPMEEPMEEPLEEPEGESRPPDQPD